MYFNQDERSRLNPSTKKGLTFMQQSEGGVKWSFSLSEKQQLSIYCEDFNVFMADWRIDESNSLND